MANLMLQFWVWQIFAACMGYMEGIFFHLADYFRLREFNKAHKDIHIHLTIVRFMMFVCMFSGLGMRNMLFFTPIAAMTFPLFHDGVYYAIRNKLYSKVYPKRFFDSPSPTSTAKTSLTFKERAILFLSGLVIWSIFITYNYQ